MSITSTWMITKMECLPRSGGQADVVCACDWTLVAYNKNYSGMVYGSVGFTYAAGDLFIPYESLTENQVIDWVKEALGSEQVTAYEASVAAQIEAQMNPPVVSKPLPWAV